ncbi:MAG: LppM family (lipo)protein [Jiangellaceae bacterium]
MNRTGALRALGAVALAAVLTGCLKLDMSLDVQDDETVDGHVIIGIDRGLADLSGADPGSISDELQGDVMEDAPKGVTAEPYEDDDYIGTRMVFEAVALDELDLGEGDDISIVHEGDEYVLSGTFDLSDSGDFGDLGEDEDFLEGFAGSMDVQLNVTFPGEVIDHNGELDGRTVTWTPEVGERLELQARSQDSGGSSFPWLIVAVLAGLVAIGAAAVLVLRGRGATAAGEPEAVDPFASPVVEPYRGTAFAQTLSPDLVRDDAETRPVMVADAAETRPVDVDPTGLADTRDLDRVDPDQADPDGTTPGWQRP